MGIIRTLANIFLADGPTGKPGNPDKQAGRDVFAAVEDAIDIVAQTVAAGSMPKAAAQSAVASTDSRNGLAARDGRTPVAGERVLVGVDGVASANNGIWVAAAGAWTRATDADAGVELVDANGKRAEVLVQFGTTFGKTTWKIANDTTPTVGTTAITLVQSQVSPDTGKANFDAVSNAVLGTGFGVGLQAASDAGLRAQGDGAYLDTAPLEPETYDMVSQRQLAELQRRAAARSNELLSVVVTWFVVYGPGANQVHAAGQSFIAGAVTMIKLLSTAARLATEIGAYMAKMIGLAERNRTAGTTYDQFGTRVLNPLVATAVVDGATTPISQADIDSGNFSTSARGETPMTAFLIGFEKLWRQFIQTDVPDTSRFDVATNTARTDALLADISTGDSLARTIDSAQAVLDAVAVSAPGSQARLSAVGDNHGQADNASHTPIADYKGPHKVFRNAVHNGMQVGKYQKQDRAPWIAMQAGGFYASLENWASQAQLEMGIDLTPFTETNGHSDYILAGPDYPYPSFGLLQDASHPWNNNRHPTANASRKRGELMARARFWVQVLKRFWFPMHATGAYVSGNEIIVAFAMMKGPIRINQPAPMNKGTVYEIHASQGITVVVGGKFVKILGVYTIPGYPNLLRIVCAEPFTLTALPIVNFGDYSVNGATNIRDSFTGKDFFKAIFQPGYTDTNLNAAGYDDAAQLENVSAFIGSTDIGNWMSNQAIFAEPMPIAIQGVN